jgi:hypothetical protein
MTEARFTSIFGLDLSDVLETRLEFGLSLLQLRERVRQKVKFLDKAKVRLMVFDITANNHGPLPVVS